MMERTSRHHFIQSNGVEQTLEHMMACTSVPSQTTVSFIGLQQHEHQQSHSPQHEVELPRFSIRSPESRQPILHSSGPPSLTPEAMRSEYSFRVIPRSHSLSPISDFEAHDNANEEYPLRRDSGLVEFSSSGSSSPHTVDHQSQDCGWETHPQSYSSSGPADDSSPTLITNDLYWDERPRSNPVEVQWVEDNGQTSLQLSHGYHHSSQLVPTPTSFEERQTIRANSVDIYPSIMFAQHSSLPDCLTSSCVPRKRPGSPSVPSPPESPGYHFGHSGSQFPASEAAYPPMANGGFGLYSEHTDHYARHAVPPTPPSRPASVNAEAAIMAASLALGVPPRSKASKQSRLAGSRRKPSNSSMRNTARQCTASSTSEAMSFVNFTPNDATKILSGVAPSGSSKTKARREREALEKRKKLSEAARAAIRAAGGDVNQLPEVI